MITMHKRLVREGFKSVSHFMDLSKYKRPTLNRYYNYDKETFEAILKNTKEKLNGC